MGLGRDERYGCEEAAKIRYPMDRFIGNWWSSAHADLVPVGEAGKGYIGANFSGIGTDFPALQDVIKHVVDAGNRRQIHQRLATFFITVVSTMQYWSPKGFLQLKR